MTKEKKHPLEELQWNIIGINNYRGCLVVKIIGGYKVFGKHLVKTPEEVDALIDNSLELVDKSVKQ